MPLYRGIYFCLGYPNWNQSLELLEILNNQPDIHFIELGLPFSDSVADGPVISRAAQVALNEAQKQGLRPSQMLEQAMCILQNSDKDIFLMTYANMIWHLQKQYQRFNQLPIKGLIIPDLPFHEQNFLRHVGVGYPMIPFATPESKEQDLQQLAPARAPFVYFVTVRGITGGKTNLSDAGLRQRYSRVRQNLVDGQTQKPLILGFGIRGAAEIRQLAEFADGFVIGTAAVEKQLEKNTYREFLDSLF